MRVVGIDLTGSQDKPSGVACLDDAGKCKGRQARDEEESEEMEELETQADTMEAQMEEESAGVEAEQDALGLSEEEFRLRANAIKEEARADLATEQEQKAASSMFSKFIECGWCNKRFLGEFKRDKEVKDSEHWRAECSECGGITYIKNIRWDGMMGVNESVEAQQEA